MAEVKKKMIQTLDFGEDLTGFIEARQKKFLDNLKVRLERMKKELKVRGNVSAKKDHTNIG